MQIIIYNDIFTNLQLQFYTASIFLPVILHSNEQQQTELSPGNEYWEPLMCMVWLAVGNIVVGGLVF